MDVFSSSESPSGSGRGKLSFYKSGVVRGKLGELKDENPKIKHSETHA